METAKESVMSQCPHSAHTDHENRIKRCETNDEKFEEALKEMDKRIGSPVLAVAIIGLIGTIFTGSAAFAGVVAAPLVQGVLKSWGWM